MPPKRGALSILIGAVEGCVYKPALAIAVAVFQHLGAAEARPGVPNVKADALYASKSIIYSNLAAKYPGGLYFAGVGLNICQPCQSVHDETIALPFTPAKNRVVRRVQVPLANLSGGSEAIISIYADFDGLPGTQLGTSNGTALSNNYCCGLVSADFGGGVSITAGKQYWIGVAAVTTANGAFDVWQYSSINQTANKTIAVGSNGSWQSGVLLDIPAVAVFEQ